MEGIPGAKTFFSAVAVKVIGPEAHHRQHRVVEFDPERGLCRQNETLHRNNKIKLQNIGMMGHIQSNVLDDCYIFLRPELFVDRYPHVRKQGVRRF